MRNYENSLLLEGYQLIAGVDEVGRGCIFGPVVSACVVLDNNFFHELIIDSKKLSPKKRKLAFEIIKENAINISVEFIDHKVIDEINILEASKLAMSRAISQVECDAVLIDAVELDLDIRSISIIKGDQKSISIAAASIVAKVIRDEYICELAQEVLDYDLLNNKGYPTKKHLLKLQENGISKYHRKSFAPVKNMLGK